MTELRKLERGDDWGHVYFAYEGEANSESGFGNASRRLAINAGDKLKIRWPNGATQTRKIVMRQFHTTVSDMGHSYPVSYELPGIEQNVRGVITWLPLDAVEVEAGIATVGRR